MASLPALPLIGFPNLTDDEIEYSVCREGMDGGPAPREFFNGKLQIYAHKPCFASVSPESPEAKTFVPSSLSKEPPSLLHFLLEWNLPLPPHKFRSIAAVRFPRSFWPGRRMTSFDFPLPPSYTVCRPNEKVDRPRPPKEGRPMRASKRDKAAAAPPPSCEKKRELKWRSFPLSTFRDFVNVRRFRSLYILTRFCSLSKQAGTFFTTSALPPPPLFFMRQKARLEERTSPCPHPSLLERQTNVRYILSDAFGVKLRLSHLT